MVVLKLMKEDVKYSNLKQKYIIDNPAKWTEDTFNKF
jgi:hypothetical protein